MVERRNDRAAFLLSGLAHLVIILTALNRVTVTRPPSAALPAALASPPEVHSRVFLPPKEAMEALQQPAPRPTPVPTPRPERDRISVGGPAELREQGPIVLRRDQDITHAVPRGTAEPGAVRADRGGATPAPSGASEGIEPGEPRPGKLQIPSIGGSLRRFEDRLARGSAVLGLPSGTTHEIGPLHFDPQGADFTEWTNHFQRELFRNWLVPQSVLWGVAGGVVEVGFVLRRDGTIAELVLLRSSGNSALDRAAANALLGSRFQILPPDFGPPELAVRMTFHYGVVPRS